jgi:nicotinamidase-related amidase
LRLPADATLIVVGVRRANRLPPGGLGEERIEANLASLIAAWRREGLPIVHLGADAPGAPSGTGATPVQGEIAVAASAAGGFAGTGLEGFLDDADATTLVLCGALGALEATARDAIRLGYHAFIPFDACRPATPFADPAFGRLRRDGAAVVDTAAALAAAAAAKSRQRREEQRKG